MKKMNKDYILLRFTEHCILVFNSKDELIRLMAVIQAKLDMLEDDEDDN